MTRLRPLTPVLLFTLLGGCPGQLRDYVGSRGAIVRPQLIRYGFSLPEITCVGDRLGATLRPRQLRFLVRATSQIQRPYFDPARFAPRDFAWAAGALRDGAVDMAIRAAFAACNVQTEPRIAAVPAPVLPEGGPIAPRPSVWLNLGAAPSGQSISVDGASLEQEASARTAWFRMIDPPPTGTSLHAYKLRIDCSTRVILPLAHRLYNAAGAVVEERNYVGPEQVPSNVESGTVTEIAFLSLCT